MAYKILLTGGNIKIMRGFFEDGREELDCMGCQPIEEDIEKHMGIFNPDVLMYCMIDEQSDIIRNVSEAAKRKPGMKFIIAGSSSDCTAFTNSSDASVSFKAENVSSSSDAQQKVLDFLSGKSSSSTSSSSSSGASSSWDDILAQIDDEIEDDGSSSGQAQAPTPEPAPAPAPSPAEEEDSNKRHILIIDDDPLMLKIIKDYLHDDYEIATAKGGKLAYKFLEKKRTDLILLDYEMPEEKGPEVFVNIRKMPGMESVPIVFMTGVKDKERVMEVVKLKPQGYISKPVEYDSLMAMVKKVFK